MNADFLDVKVLLQQSKVIVQTSYTNISVNRSQKEQFPNAITDNRMFNQIFANNLNISVNYVS